jgi:glycosyltransferase involved in cell wall biosynthesis
MKVSVIIPVYNEANTLSALLERVLAVSVPKEVVIVDDGSDEATKVLLQTAVTHNQVQLITHPQNRGKGAAVCTALEVVSGDVVIIQDADLEYSPEDYAQLLAVYQRHPETQAVYGVRNLNGRSRLMRWGNQSLTLLTNLLYGSRLHDMETCYKLIDRTLMQSLQLTSRGFEIEAEITAKLLRRGVAIQEVPIRYEHREEGKKLTPWDGLPTVKTLARCRWQRP